MAVDTNDYVIATLAQWAGDHERIKEIKPITSNKKEIPLHQLLIDAAFDEIDKNAKKCKYKTEILKTEHLRGVVFQVSEFEFSLKAYLNDLKWESVFYKNISILPRKHKVLEKDVYYKHKKNENLYNKLCGITFVKSSNPFMHVTISEMGLIESDLIWTKESDPESKGIIMFFQDLLNELESPG